ncbi:hypothetical protein HK102_004402, partial [Quaeritorhiza haematococci]
MSRKQKKKNQNHDTLDSNNGKNGREDLQEKVGAGSAVRSSQVCPHVKKQQTSSHRGGQERGSRPLDLSKSSTTSREGERHAHFASDVLPAHEDGDEDLHHHYILDNSAISITSSLSGDDVDAGTSTEEEFLSSEEEGDRLAEEKKRKHDREGKRQQGMKDYPRLDDIVEAFDSYEEWKKAAIALDKHLGNNEWKQEERCRYYDVNLIQKMVRRLRRHRKDAIRATEKQPQQNGAPSGVSIGNKHLPKESPITASPFSSTNTSPERLLKERVLLKIKNTPLYHTKEIRKILLHGGCKSNVGGLETESLYSHSYFGTKRIVEDYVDEVVKSLEFLASSPLLSLEEKYDLLKNASRMYGRSALCLSGGATFGFYHRLLKTLFENNLLPKIITGTSAGSLVAAMIGVRTDDELREEVFVPELHEHLRACDASYWDRFKNFVRTGAMFDYDDWYEKMQWVTKGPMTFLEAYKRTGRILNVSVVPDEPYSSSKQLNYITAPDVVIATAVIASSAVPGIVNPVELLMKRPEDGALIPFRGAGKRWRDGSLRSDIPERELHQLWDVNYTIVSQRGGFIASSLTQSLKLDLQKWIHLVRDLDLLPPILGFDFSEVFTQKFEGSVTITPPATWNDYIHILDDPNWERMVRYLDHGAKRCWPKLGMIRNRMRIEMCLSRLRKQVVRALKERGVSKVPVVLSVVESRPVEDVKRGRKENGVVKREGTGSTGRELKENGEPMRRQSPTTQDERGETAKATTTSLAPIPIVRVQSETGSDKSATQTGRES